MLTPNKEFWEVFKNTNGALSCAESIAIMNLAAMVKGINFIEFGTYKGKSAISAAYSLSSGVFMLVDPEFSNEEWRTEVGLKVSGINELIAVLPIDDISLNVIPKNDKYSWVFLDSGSHQDGLPMQEVKLLEDKIISGGIIAFHDWNSQFSEVKQASDYLVSTGKYEYIPINWDEIIAYINENNLEDGNKSWHHTELKNPTFVGALKRI